MNILTRVFRNQYILNISKLLSGNIVSQAINLLSVPLLTTIYDPSDFGVYGSLFFIINLYSNFIGLKYEVSVIHPEKDEDSIGLYVSSIMTSLTLSITVLFITYFFNDMYLEITLCSFFLFLVNANNLMLTRMNRFKTIAILRIVQTSLFSLFPLILYFGLDTKFLLVHNFFIAVFFTSVIGLYVNLSKNQVRSFFVDFKLMKKYKDYPLKAAPSGLINSLSTYFPIYFINGYFDSTSAGFYFLIEKLMIAPIGLISTAFSNVYRNEAQQDFYRYGNYSRITKKTISILGLLSLFVFSLIALLNELLITTFFNDSWMEIIPLIYIFLPFFATKFISGPLMSGLYVKNKLGLDIILQLVFLVVIVFSCVYGYYLESMKALISILSFCGTIYYCSLIIINYKLSK